MLEKMQLANDHQIPTVLFCGNGEHRAHQLANFLLVSLMNDHMIRRTSNIRVLRKAFTANGVPRRGIYCRNQLKESGASNIWNSQKSRITPAIWLARFASTR